VFDRGDQSGAAQSKTKTNQSNLGSYGDQKRPKKPGAKTSPQFPAGSGKLAVPDLRK
jgi:hypothetical protein